MTVVERVVFAIAEAKGREPAELDIALHEHVDTEALRLLAAHEQADWRLEFELPDHAVVVSGGEAVFVDGTRHRPLT